MTPIERRTARVLPVSPGRRVLLVCGHDPAAPDRPYWFTIGGQIEPGETARQAAAREMREEVGIVISEIDLRGPFHSGEHTYSYGGLTYHSTSLFFAVVIDESIMLEPRGTTGEIITDARWLSPADVWQAPVSNPDIPRLVALASSTLGTYQASNARQVATGSPRHRKAL